ncbi:hypothetical protein BN1013_02462 [Candidatus Rubidus massiliensis]|nr:hypothetical protein BN1013_02462 [Candidatus Rubidus massiliensis]
MKINNRLTHRLSILKRYFKMPQTRIDKAIELGHLKTFKINNDGPFYIYWKDLNDFIKDYSNLYIFKII